jgi:tRNA nucleotidyltransferase (CCA-adding enzyme)
VENVRRELGRLSAETGTALYLVGGTVRDQLLGRPTRDVDVAAESLPGDVETLARRLAARPGWSLTASHGRFGTATLSAPGDVRVDLAAARTETYPSLAGLPRVDGPAPIEKDLARRDFTLHAMARRIEADGALGPLVDPFGGRRDLDARVLRLLHPRSLADDPTRAFRAVRYAARLGLGLPPDFHAALETARTAGAFQALSGDRLRRAIEEVITEERAAEGVALLVRLGLLDDVVPGWGAAAPPPGEVASASGAEGSWTALVRHLPREDRARVAGRLSFSRRLRRAVGAP